MCVCVTVLSLLCFILYLRAISKQRVTAAYIWRGDLMEDFLPYEGGGGLFSEFCNISEKGTEMNSYKFTGTLISLLLFLELVLDLWCQRMSESQTDL